MQPQSQVCARPKLPNCGHTGTSSKGLVELELRLENLVLDSLPTKGQKRMLLTWNGQKRPSWRPPGGSFCPSCSVHKALVIPGYFRVASKNLAPRFGQNFAGTIIATKWIDH